MSTDLDVAVVGGGPGGLAAALALQAALPGSRVKVFDQANDFRLCGAGLALRANGISALHAISEECHDDLRSNACRHDLAHMVFVDKHGERTEMPSNKDPSDRSWKSITDNTRAVTGWHELHETLRRHLQPDSVLLGKRFEQLEDAEDGVQLSFSDGSTVHSKLVVGADGYFSKVRQQTLADGPPDFAETVFWRARLPWREGLAGAGSESLSFRADDKIAIVFPISNNHVVWTVAVPFANMIKAGVEYVPRNLPEWHLTALQQAQSHAGDWSADSSRIERVLKVLGPLAEQWTELTDLIKATPVDAVLEHGTYVRPAEALDGGMGRGRVTLLGDAAHPMRPTGQGVNTALEDAADLGAALLEHGLSVEALRAYEAARVPRMQEITTAEMVTGLNAYKEGVEAAKATAVAKSPRFPQGSTDPAFQKFLMSRRFKPLRPQQQPVRAASARLRCAAAPAARCGLRL